MESWNLGPLAIRYQQNITLCISVHFKAKGFEKAIEYTSESTIPDEFDRIIKIRRYERQLQAVAYLVGLLFVSACA